MLFHGENKESRHIERAGSAGSGMFHDMEVNHGGRNVGVAEQRLCRSIVDPSFQEMGREAVGNGVATGVFGDRGSPEGQLDRKRLMETIDSSPLFPAKVRYVQTPNRFRVELLAPRFPSIPPHASRILPSPGSCGAHAA